MTPHLARPGAPDPPDNLRIWLRNVGFLPQTKPADLEGPELAWLDRWSVPLAELEPSILEATMNAATTKRDGKAVAATVARRRRNSLKTVLTAAVRRGLILQARGTPPTVGSEKLWPEGSPLAKTTVYDLRHTAATTMLRAGVMPSEVARRLGHSVDVLMRVYAGVFHDERDRSNVLIDAELAEQRAAKGETDVELS